MGTNSGRDLKIWKEESAEEEVRPCCREDQQEEYLKRAIGVLVIEVHLVACLFVLLFIIEL